MGANFWKLNVSEGEGVTNRGRGGLEGHACPHNGTQQEYLLPVVASQ